MSASWARAEDPRRSWLLVLLAAAGPLFVDRDEGENRDGQVQGHVLEPLNDHGDPVFLRQLDGPAPIPRRCGGLDLLEVVTHHERRPTRALADLLDGRSHDLDTSLGAEQPSRHHHPVGTLCDLERLTDLREPHRAGTGDLGGLQNDQPLQQGVVVVLEGEVDNAVAGNNEVARHLQCERGLAQARPSAQKHQLTRTEAAGQRTVQGREAGRLHLGSDDLVHAQDTVRVLQDGAQGLESARPPACVRHCHASFQHEVSCSSAIRRRSARRSAARRRIRHRPALPRARVLAPSSGL